MSSFWAGKERIVKINGIYRFSLFERFALACAFSDRFIDLGYKSFLSKLGIDPKRLILPKQTHKGRVVLIRQKERKSTILADGLITKQKNLAIGVLTADCLPIFLYAADTKAIGLIHAGWKGTQFEIAKKAVEAMCREFSCQAPELWVGFGPGIRVCCYEVGREFAEYFPGGLKRKGNKLHLDLIELNIKQLLDCGVKQRHILDSRICTACRNNEFFSYRREGKDAGRMLSVMMLK